MKIFISAAEASSDLHGSVLLTRLQEQAQREGIDLQTFGVGGDCLRTVGHEIVVPASELLVMGFTEVLGRLFAIRRTQQKLIREIERRRPDALVLMDYPSFHFNLVNRLRRSWGGALRCPVFYYIPPKVWASRENRVTWLSRWVKKVYCLFPFEEAFLRTRGVNAVYFGNPLSDELPLSLSQADARSQLGNEKFDPKGVSLVLMPGSRPSEIRRHFPILLDTVRSVRQKLHAERPGGWTLLIPLAETAEPGKWFERYRDHLDQLRSDGFEVILLPGQSHLAMRAADAGLIKSGTSTLEAAVLGCPHVVFYQVSALSAFFIRWILGYRGAVSLVNLFEGGPQRSQNLVEELILDRCRPAELSRALEAILSDENGYRSRMIGEFDRLKQQVLGSGSLNGSPSDRIASDLLREIQSAGS